MRRFGVVLAVVFAALAGAAVSASGQINTPSTAPASGSMFVAITPCRLADTRSTSTVGSRNTPLGASETVSFTVRGTNGNCTIPNEATAVTTNMTAVNQTAGSYLTVWPANAGRPNASSLNYVAGASATPNAVTVALSPDGRINAWNRAGTVNLIIDIVGYYAPAQSGNPNGNRLTNAQIGMLRWDQDPGKPASLYIGNDARDLVFDGTYVWVIAGGQVGKIDTVTNSVISWVSPGSNPSGLAFDGTFVWVSLGDDDRLAKIDPTTFQYTTVAVGHGPRGLAFDGTWIWVANMLDNTVEKVDPVANQVVGTVTGLVHPLCLAFDGSYMWVSNNWGNSVSKINRDTVTAIATVGLGTGAAPVGLAYDGSRMWVAANGTDEVKRVDPIGETVTDSILVASLPYYVAFDGRSLWVTSLGSGVVTKINPAIPKIVDRPVVAAGTAGIVFDGTTMWVTANSAGTLHKLAPYM